MSDTTITAEPRDGKGRFLPGNSGFSGRPKGSRNKLGEQFLEDLRDTWAELGVEALRKCAREEPGQFCRIVAGLLPRDVNLNLDMVANATDLLSAYTLLRTTIDADPQAVRRLRRLPQKGDDVS